MNIEYAIFGSLGILFVTIMIFYPKSPWDAVSTKKILKPDIQIKIVRPNSIMWNH